MKRISFLLLIFVITLSACMPPPAATPVTTVAPPGSPTNPEASPSAYPAAAEPGAAYPGPGASAAVPGADPGAYPGSTLLQPTVDPYPGAEAPAGVITATPIPTPTLDPSLGQVKGRLLEGASPVTEAYLYLAELKTDEQGRELVAKITTGAPFTITDADGNFLFYNVKAGRYAIVLDVVLNAYLLNVPDKEEAILFTVENGKTTDLGELAYDEVPRPSSKR